MSHEAVRERVCTSKVPLGRETARRSASALCRQTGEVLRAYRCPFATDRHWHVGRVPSMESVRSIAAAIRNLEPRREEGASP